jgi:hypothetical protein
MLKDIVDNFVEKNKGFKLYISYGLMRDLDLYSTTLAHGVYSISSRNLPFEVFDNNEFYSSFYPECTEKFNLGKNEYIFNPDEAKFERNQFLLILDTESGDFKVFGNPNRAKILSALNRLTNIIKGLKYIKENQDKGCNYLDKTFHWLNFSIQGPNKNELHFDSNYIGGFCILYQNGVWEIDSSIEKSFERGMNRLFPKKNRKRK